jgi:hypothetical protein
MAHEYPVIDLNNSNVPDLADVAEEVHRTRQPRVIRRADEELAVIAPVRKKAARSPFKKKSQADIDAFLSAAGSWKDVDIDKLKADIAESRRISTKPRPQL